MIRMRLSSGKRKRYKTTWLVNKYVGRVHGYPSRVLVCRGGDKKANQLLGQEL